MISVPKFLLTFCLLSLFAVSGAYPNVWIDENFNDGVAFDPGDLDTYDYQPPTTPPLTMTHTGSIVPMPSFDGSSAYMLAPGQSISVVNYKNKTNGSFQYLQFAAMPGTIPMAPQIIAVVNFRWNIGAQIYDYIVDFYATGTGTVDVRAHDGVIPPVVIGTYSTSGQWHFITLQMQKDVTPASDTDTGQVNLTQGMRFYCSSLTPGYSILGPGINFDGSVDWTLTTVETFYIDAVYFEGGMTWDATTYANRNLRLLNLTSVEQWSRY